MRSRLAFVVLLAFVGFVAPSGCSCRDNGGEDKPDAGEVLPDAGPGETVCANLAPLASGTCEVTAGGEAKLIKGNILTPETVFRGGQVKIDPQGQITCVGCDCEQGGETLVVCPSASVSPGLINTHDHITFTHNDPYTQDPNIRYDHRHQWRKGQDGKPKIPAAGGASGVRISWGELRFVMGGATSIVGSGGQAGLLRNLDNATNQEGLNRTPVEFETFPLGDSGGLRRTADCNYGGTTVTADDIMNVKSFEPHTAEGVDSSANNEFKCESSDTYDTAAPQTSENLLLAKTAMIHGIGLTAADFGAMAAAGAALIWSPRSNVTLYGDTARVTMAAAFGVEIALGTDWMPTGSMNLLRELRCADELNQLYYDNYFTDKQLWQMVTLNAAAVTATDDAIGLLAPNHVADIAIFAGNNKPGYRAVLEAEPKDVALVMRSGVALYGDDAVVAALTNSCDTVDVCGVPKRVCTKREVGKTYQELVTAVGDVYPAFSCGVPENEPSCVPRRPTTTNNSTIFTGGAMPNDADGDGVTDGSDNCPAVFNPVRPMDNGMQPNLDNDAEGDACDPCPGDANTTTCTPINPDDRDHDGVTNTSDNCPDTPNPQQSDGDTDGKGDACDPCPSEANPGTAGCPTTIYKIKDGTTPVGSNVRLLNALVTGKGTNGFFVQVKPGDAGYTVPDNSGLFVYTGPMSTQLANAVVGMRVTIDGSVANFQGQLELDAVSAVIPETMIAEPAPTPVFTSYAQIKTGGAKAMAYESVIVSLGAATATAVNAMFGEYTLTSGADTLVVDDYLYVTPGASVGMQVTAITGILAFRQSASKLEPRGASDIVQGTPTLASFGPALSYVRVGQNNVNTFPVGGELTVTLSGPAQGDTNVDLTFTGNAIQIPQNRVTVLSGQTSAKVVLSGQSISAGVSITAQLAGGAQLSATVRVLGANEAPTAVTLAPATASVAPGGMVVLTATLDIPAPPGGQAITLSVAPSGAGTVTAATVAENTLSTTFTYADVTGASSTVTAQAAAAMDTAMITVMTAGGNNLVINEVDYDQVLTDSAEYIEIYNPTGAAISLANVGVVLINGSLNTAYPTPDSIIDLSPVGSLPAGGYLVLAGANIAVPSGAIKYDPGWTSDQVQNGSPDGIALVDTSSNTLIDAFSYEGSVTMAEVPGIANPVSLVEGTALSSAVTDLNTGPGALCRSPNGGDSDNANVDWKFCSTLTPGAANP